MPQRLPAVSLVAVPGRRRVTLDIAREIERRGFPAIFSPSRYANFSLCEALAFATERIVFGTAISPIYARFRPERRVPARSLRRALPPRHRRRPCAKPDAHGRHARPAA